MTVAAQVKAHNTLEAKKFRDYLDMLVKYVTFKVVNDTLVDLMMPNEGNYWNLGSPTGNKVVHGSSNAAFNWRVSVGGAIKPYEDWKGRYPVGDAYDKRSSESKGDAYDTIDVRREKDINNGLKKAIFAKGSKVQTVTISNALKHSRYISNANLEAAANHAGAYANSSLKSTQHYISVMHNFKDTPTKDVFISDISYVTSQSVFQLMT